MRSCVARCIAECYLLVSALPLTERYLDMGNVDPHLRKIFAHNTRQLRLERYLRQEELTDVARLPCSVSNAIERNISLDRIEKIMPALRTNSAILLSQATR